MSCKAGQACKALTRASTPTTLTLFDSRLGPRNRNKLSMCVCEGQISLMTAAKSKYAYEKQEYLSRG